MILRVRHRAAAMVTGAITIAAGIAVMVVHNSAGTDGDTEGWFAAAGFGAPFVGAGSLAVIGGALDRPALCVAAGIALHPMSVVSIILWPLLIPAALMVWAGLTNAPRARSLAAALLHAIALIAVFGFLVLHQDPVTWTTPTGSGKFERPRHTLRGDTQPCDRDCRARNRTHNANTTEPIRSANDAPRRPRMTAVQRGRA